ncbi:Hypothetical predicted protein [Mytilus galloprovincialis]|uniref:Uncharacterized protein n=1 Tax=Mytilus galloprovincialis TaxID=29158 RepID=A0A8B6EYM8_MYTGA|nr:Hypothetical predicted protein [Mytilus galloprovincialis]
MGIIAGITPGYNYKTIVQRLNVSLDDILQIGKIDLHQYNFDRISKVILKFESLAAQQSDTLPDNISLLCITLWPKKRIGWSAMCNLVQDGVYPVDTLDQNEVRDSISTFRKSHIEYRTARLWFLYMDMVDLLRNFIKAERTGNWTLHLQTIKEMLPYFAAAGHNLYLKSAYVYLQQMHGLSRTNPVINEALMSGFHVMRRSDRFWSGLSSDLVIEQVLMRCIKTTGGLTRGRRMTDAQRSLWILSMPQCIQMNEAKKCEFQERNGIPKTQQHFLTFLEKEVHFQSIKNCGTSKQEQLATAT